MEYFWLRYDYPPVCVVTEDPIAEGLRRMEAHAKAAPARRAAASADMLIALKDLLAAVGGEDSTDIWCRNARAAIRRAERGDQP